jgi:hypothetical protein
VFTVILLTKANPVGYGVITSNITIHEKVRNNYSVTSFMNHGTEARDERKDDAMQRKKRNHLHLRRLGFIFTLN